MLNTALSTSQQRVLLTAIPYWDMFSLDVCYVLQFYREVLAGTRAAMMKKRKRMETDGHKMKQSNCQDLSSIFYKSIKSKRLTSNTWSL